MSEPTITCPNCKSEIRLTESLAAPLLEQTKFEFQRQLAAKDVEITRREEAITKSAADLEQQRSAIETQIAARLDAERSRIVKEETERAKRATADDIAAKDRDLLDATERLKLTTDKLATAQKAALRARFPFDVIEPVAKGVFGGDVVQRVVGAGGQPCGSILWETKRTKAWSDGWLTKLRDDKRAAKADLALLVSQTLPKDLETFDLIDGVWVTGPKCAMAVAMSLREALILMSTAKLAGEGQQCGFRRCRPVIPT